MHSFDLFLLFFVVPFKVYGFLYLYLLLLLALTSYDLSN